MKLVLSYFFRGLLYIVPIVIVFYIIYKLFLFIGSALHDLGISIHPAIDPIIGILALFVFLILIGILGSTIIFKPIFLVIESIFERAPIINIFYSSIKDLMSALFGQHKKYNQPVLVKMGSAEIEKIGFVTRQDLTALDIGNEKVAVYFPHSFNFSGNLFIVPKSNLTPISGATSDIMKFIVSGGVADISKN
jgi:uncharacterized membrane protein